VSDPGAGRRPAGQFILLLRPHLAGLPCEWQDGADVRPMSLRAFHRAAGACQGHSLWGYSSSFVGPLEWAGGCSNSARPLPPLWFWLASLHVAVSPGNASQPAKLRPENIKLGDTARDGLLILACSFLKGGFCVDAGAVGYEFCRHSRHELNAYPKAKCLDTGSHHENIGNKLYTWLFNIPLIKSEKEVIVTSSI
jgi:hypothetical protein